MDQIRKNAAVIALAITFLSGLGAVYMRIQNTPTLEQAEAKFVSREVWQQESAHQRELLAEVKSTVTETNRTVNEFIRGERHGR
jgi:hypothetical protein